MPATSTTLMRHTGDAASFAVRPVLRRALQRFRRWREIRATVRALDALDDHVLADVGIPRGLIEAEVRRRLDVA